MMPFCDLRPHLTRLFSPRATPNGILLFSFAFPVCRDLFRPSQPERNFILSLYMHPPSAAARGSRAALQYFRSYRPPFTTRGTGSPNMPNTSNDRARNALRSAETEKFSRPQTLRPPQIGVQGRPYKMNTRKNCIHRRGGGYIILGLSAGAGAAGDIIIWKYGTAESARGINNMEIYDGREAAGKILNGNI